jgi:hypothetical protein
LFWFSGLVVLFSEQVQIVQFFSYVSIQCMIKKHVQCIKFMFTAIVNLIGCVITFPKKDV